MASFGWQVEPLPAGSTFTDSVTGRTWTVSGSGLELWQTYLPEFNWQYNPYDPGTNTYTGWVDPGPTDPGLSSFRGTRQVFDWWKGPRSMNLQCTFLADVQTPLALALSYLIRIQVKVGTPSGGENTRTLFEGRISDVKSTLTPSGIPRFQVQIVDDYGWNTQTAFAPSLNFAAAPSGNMLSGIWTNHLNTIYPIVLSGPDLGVQMTFNTGSGTNVANEIQTLMRGELGILWPARDGRAVFFSGDWYVTRPSPANAVLGTNLGAVAGTWELPVSVSTPVKTMRDLYNQGSWTGPFGSQGTSQTAQQTQFGVRSWQDAVYVVTGANAQANLDRLISVLALSPGAERVESVRFPADLTIDAMNYATFADPGDYVYVTKEWLPDKWNQQVEAHVIGVTQEWSPSQGWWTTLRVTEKLIPYTFNTPGRTPG